MSNEVIPAADPKMARAGAGMERRSRTIRTGRAASGRAAPGPRVGQGGGS